MDAELTLYIPAARTAELLPHLLGAAHGLAQVSRDKPAPVLDLERLRCLWITMHGSGEHLRTPFVTPLTRTDAFNFEPPATAPQELPGPDWLVLGRAGEDLARHVRQGLLARKAAGLTPVLRIAPFAALSGSVPQTPRADDVPFSFRKSSKNFNQPTWVKSMQRLLELPEERWGEVGIANTADQLHIFDAALTRLVTRPPRLVVDLGCGVGQIARSLAKRFPEALVVGVDASAEAINVARASFDLPNLKFAAVDFSKPLNFQQGSVDLLVSTNALPYAQDQLGAARELFGLLAPDGVLLNHCRAEESHLFWDFPRSLVLPTNTQIFLADWVQAAADTGRNTEVWQVPLGMSPVFYQPNQAPGFAEPLNAHAEAHRHDDPGEYRPWASHVLLAHAAQARPLDAAAKTRLPLAHNHQERLSAVLNAVVSAPEDIQNAAISAWIYNARAMGVMPEAMGYLQAVLPGAAEVLQAVLGPGLAEEGGA